MAPCFFRVGDVRGRGCRLRVGVVGGGEEVTQRLKVKGGGVGWADFRNDFLL